MTTPNDPPETVSQWQTRMLLTIGNLSAEHARILDAGWTGFDAVDDGGPEAAWQQHLEALDGEREGWEQIALSAGVDAGQIAAAAALGQQRTRPRVDAATRALSSPARDDAAAGFHVDMLAVELWRLERMAAIHADRSERIATGRYSFGGDPETEPKFLANMELFHQRATALAEAARITAPEAEELWGTGAEPVRRQHAVDLKGHNELELIQKWKTYARSTDEPTRPFYVPPDSATGTRAGQSPVTPPTPQQMILAAQASLRAEFLDAALAGVATDLDADATAALGAISAAVDDALPADFTSTAPGTDHQIDLDLGHHTDYGNDP
jgi:hypothetical protein